MRRLLALAVCVFFVSAGCGDDDEDAAGEFSSPEECMTATIEVFDGDVTAAQLVEMCGVSAEVAEGAVAESERSEDVEPEPTTTAAGAGEPSAQNSSDQAGSSSTAIMPDIACGMDLQLAQDLVQDAGIFFSRSEDATGQERFQVSDRNWTVVDSEPAAGTPIGEDEVVFFVVKDEEFPGC